MSISDHPEWPLYKTAIVRLAEAGSRLENARQENDPELEKAKRAFDEALQHCEAVRERLNRTD